MTTAMKQELKKHMEEQFMFEFDSDITEDTDLFKAGILDSFGYLSLMKHVEEEYGVPLGEEILGNVMVSLSGIVGFVDTARARAAGSR
ncbi:MULTISPECIES: acyl carrier protein [Streptomyces]|nr:MULTISPECIES: acyl carrier protein [Streptomyces]MCR8573855.1 acyl carrier protein [Streptomyces sp. Isolate_219]MCX5445499.1 acyl carrier protein [Streptomyces libani]WAU00971.1 acyl carrier protein [Streptomyces libani subsp. libani]WAU08833.1 acyl carrier protein [Streptomyces nigrescens]WDT53172.1 acyl carrier protein [Streptomyces sp. G7(2002)]